MTYNDENGNLPEIFEWITYKTIKHKYNKQFSIIKTYNEINSSLGVTKLDWGVVEQILSEWAIEQHFGDKTQWITNKPMEYRDACHF